MGEIQPKKTWLEILQEHKQAFKDALPKVGITPERVIRTALTTMRLNPELMKCEPKSVIASIIQACELGLTLSPSLGHAYLVPYNNTKKGIKECTFIVGYRGFVDLMKRTGKVDEVKSCIVYENEPFEIGAGTTPYLKHTPLPPGKRGEKIIGAYAIVMLKDGAVPFEFMWIEDIMKRRERSKAKDSGPWVTDTEEMIKKTAIRAIAKRAELSPEVTKAAVIDEYNEAGVIASDVVIDTEIEEEKKSLESSVIVKPVETQIEKEKEKEKDKDKEKEKEKENGKLL